MAFPTWLPMRLSAAHSKLGPTSFNTSRRTGLLGSEANAKPIRPPMEVPTQSTCDTARRASTTTMSATYWGSA